MEMKWKSKNAKNFYCENCDFICSKQCDYNRHVMTRKHQMEINGNTLEIKKTPKYVCDDCSREYKTNSGLWKHMKGCKNAKKTPKNAKKTPLGSSSIELDINIDKEMLIKMLLKNQDIMEGVLLKNGEVMEKMVEMMPQMGMNNSHNTNTNTNTNSHNTNNFNIQMFLHDHCKNAMNLTDFIQSLPITSETYDSTIANGLTKTITNMMVNGLNDLDILERPIHCTDASRKILYVKESDKWEKDNNMLHIMKGIKQLSLKQRTMINKWKDANEGWDKDDKLQSKMTNLVFNSMTQIEIDDKETSKIIKSVSKSVYLDNDTKHNYTK